MTAMDTDRCEAPRIARRVLELAVLVAGGIGLALPLILPLG